MRIIPQRMPTSRENLPRNDSRGGGPAGTGRDCLSRARAAIGIVRHEMPELRKSQEPSEDGSNASMDASAGSRAADSRKIS